MSREYREEETAGVEADGGECESGRDCGEPGEVATPDGLLCHECAGRLANHLRQESDGSGRVRRGP
jgi:hypothetical protein